MNGDPEQNEVHFESRPQPENKLESIRDITRAIEDGDKEYINRLDVIADLLTDSNVNLEKMIGIGAVLENHLKEIRAGFAAIVARQNTNITNKEIGAEVNRILYDRPAEWSAGLMAWLKEYHGP